MQSIAQEISESMDLLQAISKSLGIDLHKSLEAEKEKEKSKKKKGKEKSPEEEIKEVTERILKDVEAKVTRVQTKKTSQGKILYYHIKMGHSEYVLKSYILTGIGHLSLILWDEEQKSLLDVIASGYMKDYYKLIAVGKNRLSRWG